MSMLAARLSVTAFTKRLSTAALPSAQLSRSFVKVGDKVPVNYLKDESAPVIKADSEYPDWLSAVGIKGLSKAELIAKFEAGGGPEALTKAEAKRLKRLIGLDQIREHNAAATAESS